MESKKKFVIMIAVLSVALIASIATMIIVLVTANQNATSAVNIKYTAQDVYVELQANATVGAVTTTFTDNGTTTGNSSLILSPTTTSGTLSQPNSNSTSINLNKTDDTVVFEYLFTNKTDNIDVKIDLTAIPGDASGETKDNLDIKYVYSDTELSHPELETGSTTYTSQLLPAYSGEITKKYIYIVASIHDYLYNASLQGNFAWALTKPDASDITTYTLNIGSADYVEREGSTLASSSPTTTSYTYRSLDSSIDPNDISLLPF